MKIKIIFISALMVSALSVSAKEYNCKLGMKRHMSTGANFAAANIYKDTMYTTLNIDAKSRSLAEKKALATTQDYKWVQGWFYPRMYSCKKPTNGSKKINVKKCPYVNESANCTSKSSEPTIRKEKKRKVSKHNSVKHSHKGREHHHPLPQNGVKHRHGNGSIGKI